MGVARHDARRAEGHHPAIGQGENVERILAGEMAALDKNRYSAARERRCAFALLFEVARLVEAAQPRGLRQVGRHDRRDGKQRLAHRLHNSRRAE